MNERPKVIDQYIDAIRNNEKPLEDIIAGIIMDAVYDSSLSAWAIHR